jgi:hypothetical protein
LGVRHMGVPKYIRWWLRLRRVEEWRGIESRHFGRGCGCVVKLKVAWSTFVDGVKVVRQVRQSSASPASDSRKVSRPATLASTGLASALRPSALRRSRPPGWPRSADGSSRDRSTSRSASRHTRWRGLRSDPNRTRGHPSVPRRASVSPSVVVHQLLRLRPSRQAAGRSDRGAGAPRRTWRPAAPGRDARDPAGPTPARARINTRRAAIPTPGSATQLQPGAHREGPPRPPTDTTAGRQAAASTHRPRPVRHPNRPAQTGPAGPTGNPRGDRTRNRRPGSRPGASAEDPQQRASERGGVHQHRPHGPPSGGSPRGRPTLQGS